MKKIDNAFFVVKWIGHLTVIHKVVGLIHIKGIFYIIIILNVITIHLRVSFCSQSFYTHVGMSYVLT